MPARIAALLLLALCSAACPVPIRHTETLAPPIVGVLRHSDGTPIVGAQIGVAYGYAKSPCAQTGDPAQADGGCSAHLD